MTDNFFNDYNGLNTLEWWMGQVVDEKNWAGNEKDTLHKRDDISGWGKRYKVRIFGRDSKKKDTKDDELEMAEVLYPVTAGSGHAGATQTANIRQGAYVVGFYKDGIDATEPIIMGVLGNNAQTRLEGKDPNDGFVPRTGYKGLTGDKTVSTKNMYAEGPSSIFFDEAGNVNPLSWNVHLLDQVKDGSSCEFVPKTRACEGPGGETQGMQSAIKNALAEVNRIKAETNSFIGSVSNLNASIDKVVADATNLIAQGVKVTIDKGRSYIVNKINAGISDLVNQLPPNKRADANDQAEKATDTLQCVFNNIIKGLTKLIEGLLKELLDQTINSILCSIENFLANLLNSILDQITNAINAALSILSSVFGAAISLAGQFLDVLSLISGVLNFLSCDEQPACTAGNQWSFWNGASCVLDNVSADLDKKIAGIITAAANQSTCDSGPVSCGPPVIDILGSTGIGALANPIISATGSILAIDLMNGGSGYTTLPTVAVTQDCDNGSGAVIQPILDTQVATGAGTGTTTGIGSITGFNIIDSGAGYLPAPNGSTGANGITFSGPCDTIIKKLVGGYQSAKKPGTFINVIPGDIVYLPPSTIVQVFDSNGISVQTLNGLGQLTPITITSAGSFTSPDCVPTVTPITPITYTTYPVVLEIGSIVINNPGSNYTAGDPIVITPDNGAVLTPVYNDVGSLIEVKIENPGIGFTDYPRIFIDSETGINAEIIPQFKILRVGNLPQDKDIAPTNAQIIHVVDCVGKIPPKTTFDIVPR